LVAAGLAVVVMTVGVIAERLIPRQPRHKRSQRDHPSPFVFRRNGDHWTVGSGADTFQLRDHRGLGHLQVLIRDYPGHAFPVGELDEMIAGRAPADTGDDAEYRQRREHLVDEIEDLELDLKNARQSGEDERAGEIHRDIKRTRKQLVRLDVTTGLEAAIDRIAERDPTIGEHLRSSVHHTEAWFYCYAPEPARTPAWEL
jgi:hypothetical protein